MFVKDYGYISVFDLEEIPTGETKKEEYKMMHEEELLNLDTKEYPEIDTIIVYSENGGYKKIKEVSNVIVEGNKVYYETPDDYDLSITVSDFELSGNEMKVEVSEEDSKKAEVNINKIAAEIRLAAGLDNPIKENTENTKGVKEMTNVKEEIKENTENTKGVKEMTKVKEEIKENTENTKGVKEMTKVKEEIKENTTRVKPVVNKVEKKGRKGIQVKGFNYNIATTTNSAIYDSFVAFHGTKKDAWLVWGRFNGTLEKDINGQKEANFEFLLFENGKLIVTYWKAERYKIVAEKLAKAAIKRLLEENVR